MEIKTKTKKKMKQRFRNDSFMIKLVFAMNNTLILVVFNMKLRKTRSS